jgi:exonuclease III
VLAIIFQLQLYGYTFRVANYNVENLFDLNRDIGEYKEYQPNSFANWNEDTMNKKISNISKVLLDLDSEIVALQEIESVKALTKLKNHIKVYPHMAISNGKDTTVKCAILSKFKIKAVKELEVSRHPLVRNILEVHLDVKGKDLIIFVNHWKAKSGAESYRIEFARTLKKRLVQLDKTGTDYIVMGDLNSNYNEFQTFKQDRKLNNTSGKTGINHVLKTVYNDNLFSQKDFQSMSNEYMFNLWLEVPIGQRHSGFFNKKGSTLDNIILPKSLFDNKGISYKDDSFKVFNEDYLLKGKTNLYRWEKKKGKFTGNGFSDHLPIYAEFTTEPYIGKDKNDIRTLKTIASLYKEEPGRKNYVIKDVTVIHQDDKGVIVKTLNDRAIYIYSPNFKFEISGIYDVGVREIDDFFGRREVVRADKITKTGDMKARDFKKLFVYNTNFDFNNLIYQNEVITEISGEYKDGFFVYNNNKIKLYFANKTKKPKMNGPLTLKNVVVGFYKAPQLIVY